MQVPTITIRLEKPILAPHALIGIVAVLLAAINSSLGGGLIGAGLEDLRGAWGLGVDEAAYVVTAFNAAQMFMGSMAVVMAARFGHRPVLLYAGVIYALSSLFLPLVPRTAITLFFLVLCGLSSGTFYPLCLSFIARNLPLRLLPFGVAAYSMDVLAGNHLVHAMEGYFMDHMGWQWIFWFPAVFTVPMLFAVRKGIPPTPKEQLIPHASYGEVFYVSAGLTMLFIALDQGERLDWYNNGLINGLVVSAVILLVFAFIRRKVNPHPFLDFSYLKTRNILILGVMMLSLRFFLLRPGSLIPQFLETLHQYRPPEIGALLILSLIPYLVGLPVIAHLMRHVYTRIILASGLVLLGIINFFDVHALSTWIGQDFIVQQMIGSVGSSLVYMGTVAGIVFEGRLTGAYRNRAGAYCQGAYFQICRIFGSIASASALRRLILYRQHFWQTKLVSGLAPSWPYQQTQAYLGTALAPQAAGPLQRPEIASGLISHSVREQAFTLACDDAFMVLALGSIFCLVAVLMMCPIPLPHQLPDVGAAPPKAPGDGGTAPEGDGGKAPEGDGGKAPDGDGGKAPEGDGGKAPEGDGGKAPEGDGGKAPDGES